MIDLSGRKMLQEHVLRRGQTLPWSLFDSQENLLLKQGVVLESEKQIDTLIRKGAHYFEGPDQTTYLRPLTVPEEQSSFGLINEMLWRLESSFNLVLDEEPCDQFIRSILKLAIDIQTICGDKPNVVLGTTQLIIDAPVNLIHSFHTALISEILGAAAGVNAMERISLIAAALTQNLGMQEIRDLLSKQETPLTDEQKNTISNHPRRSAQILRSIGVEDRRWLRAVLQHHERLDGSGYPSALSGEQIAREARILAIADSYVAMTRPRAYRTSFKTKSAMLEIRKQLGTQIDSELGQLFLEEMGDLSPGTLFRLSSGEVAIVIGRAKVGEEPCVALLTDPHSVPLETPLITDEFSPSDATGLLDIMEYRHLVAHLGPVWNSFTPFQ